MSKAKAARAVADTPRNDADLPEVTYHPADSPGYLVRQAHRAFQRALEQHIAPQGVTRGQWYFLRVLWEEDGLTQRELSQRVGTMEPTTIVALRSMEAAKMVRRARSETDRRKVHVWLTDYGRSLKNRLLPLAREINEGARRGLSDGEVKTLLSLLERVTDNLENPDG